MQHNSIARSKHVRLGSDVVTHGYRSPSWRTETIKQRRQRRSGSQPPEEATENLIGQGRLGSGARRDDRIRLIVRVGSERGPMHRHCEFGR